MKINLLIKSKKIKSLIIKNLSDDLLSPKYRKIVKNNKSLPPVFGHCYLASETAYHLMGGKKKGWTPQFMYHLGTPHWFLKHKSGFILDITANQFQSPPDYSKAVGKGFLTKQPCKRATLVLKKIKMALA